MCGIFLYASATTSPAEAPEGIAQKRILAGLRSLHAANPGYDSCGMTLVAGGSKSSPSTTRIVGTTDALEAALPLAALEAPVLEKSFLEPMRGSSAVFGVGALAHTRWATHGAVTEKNAHPLWCGEFVVAHNGVVTNGRELRTVVTDEGVELQSDTDTEAVVALLHVMYKEMTEGSADTGQEKRAPPSFLELASAVLQRVEGTFALVFASPAIYPGEYVCAQRGSSLIAGRVGAADLFDGVAGGAAPEYVVSSVPAVVGEHCGRVVYLADHDVLHLAPGGATLCNDSPSKTHDSPNMPASRKSLHRSGVRINAMLEKVTRGDHEHFMHKEIYEQAEALANAVRGRIVDADDVVRLGGIARHVKSITRCRRVVLLGCASSYHAAISARGVMEELVDMPVAVEVCSNFLDRKHPIYRDDCCIFLSNSGETRETRLAAEYCASRGAFTIGITNSVGSQLSRSTVCGVHQNAGTEGALAATKAYTTQVMCLILLALFLGQDRASMEGRRKEIIAGIKALPALVERTLKLEPQVKAIAESMVDAKHCLVMGRGYSYAAAMEGALKLKEVANIHAEGVASGELKHGTLALIDETMPCIVLATRDSIIDQVINALAQVVTRAGAPTVIVTEGDTEVRDHISAACPVLEVPATVDCLQGIINVIPLQLLAYHLACLKGNDVDRPRHLSKVFSH